MLWAPGKCLTHPTEELMRHSSVHSSQDHNSSYSIVQNLTNRAHNDHLIGLPQIVFQLMAIFDVFVLQVATYQCSWIVSQISCYIVLDLVFLSGRVVILLLFLLFYWFVDFLCGVWVIWKKLVFFKKCSFISWPVLLLLFVGLAVFFL